MADFRRVFCGLAIVFALAWSQSAPAQAVRYNDRPIVNYYSPGTAWSAEVHAHADYLRAYGEASEDVGYAHLYHANAYSIDLDNWVKELVAKQERERLGLERRARMHRSLVKIQELQNTQYWKMIRDYPELSPASIQSGRAMNFLMDRLSGGLLAYKLSAGAQDLRVTEEALMSLQVTPELLSQLRVKQELASGKSTVFHLDEASPLEVAWWPAALRSSDIQNERTRFELARAELMAADKQDFEKSLKSAIDAFLQLRMTFDEQHSRSTRQKTTEDFRRFKTGDRFLKSLFGELVRIEEVGPKALSNESLKFEGESLISMLTHMSRNGLEFAPATPGDEAAYDQLFHMMRDLYLVVEDNKADDAKP